MPGLAHAWGCLCKRCAKGRVRQLQKERAKEPACTECGCSARKPCRLVWDDGESEGRCAFVPKDMRPRGRRAPLCSACLHPDKRAPHGEVITTRTIIASQGDVARAGKHEGMASIADGSPERELAGSVVAAEQMSLTTKNETRAGGGPDARSEVNFRLGS